MPTLNGHGLGKKDSSADPRDHLYGFAREGASHLPPSVDLRKNLPAVFDQGNTSSCGAESGAALAQFLFPQMRGGFSALALYYEVRKLEGDVRLDDGVETRDVLKVMKDIGVIPDGAWPFNPTKVTDSPPPNVPHIKIGSYARLVGASDMLSCLAAGFPFVLGFMVPESLDGAAIAHSGIMQRPDLAKDRIVGGHDVLVVGYDATFKSAPFFKASGLDPATVDDTMLLIRNSWGPGWSPNFRGHFWMPLSYAINPTTGGDAWTARADAAMKAGSPLPAIAKPKPTAAQYAAGRQATFGAIRRGLDTKTSYGGWVSDDKLHSFTDEASATITESIVAAGNS